ncbi:hypothetical protein, partial [Actinotalea sp.]|uniref:hypothetical protein n=1 Tax=Actinotalea sp. TaxID=1872145 RepID=UPI003561D5FA
LGPAVLVGLGFSAITLLVGPVAAALGQDLPGLAGGAVALLTPVVVLAVDAGEKAMRSRRAARRATGRSGLRTEEPPSTPAR